MRALRRRAAIVIGLDQRQQPRGDARELAENFRFLAAVGLDCAESNDRFDRIIRQRDVVHVGAETFGLDVEPLQEFLGEQHASERDVEAAQRDCGSRDLSELRKLGRFAGTRFQGGFDVVGGEDSGHALHQRETRVPIVGVFVVQFRIGAGLEVARAPASSNANSPCCGGSGLNGAGGEDRTPDLRFTKPLHYRCATPASLQEMRICEFYLLSLK